MVAFKARYGDKMSSVLDIQYKKPKQFGGSAYIGILNRASVRRHQQKQKVYLPAWRPQPQQQKFIKQPGNKRQLRPFISRFPGIAYLPVKP